MGGVRALHDVIVVGMGPGGAATASMLRAPSSFGIRGAGALDVLALEARGAVPVRDRVVGLYPEALDTLAQADDVVGRFGSEATAPAGTTRISHVERTMRDAADLLGVEARYDTAVAGVRDLGRAGVEVSTADGTVHRARFLVDASGGRVGAFQHGPAQGHVVYLTGQAPPIGTDMTVHGGSVLARGAGRDRALSSVFAFNDARAGATIYVKYPSVPSNADDPTWTRRLLRRHLEEGGVDPRGLRDAQFLSTPLVRSPSAAAGNFLAVGDTVRRLSPETALGVTNSLADARAAATAIHDALGGTATQSDAFAGYAANAAMR